ncbi:hypothetical protein Cco03nite_68640 [Catellatospora coxensis]|uniref:Uncharacterized protein n=1 Tax=Catellatospora coxensis TaxID=310354 RepID=A0A8J3L6P1_9ACTN|nr:hypothetical protein Cco03nite_68640 [Catellatospora coxensis]
MWSAGAAAAMFTDTGVRGFHAGVEEALDPLLSGIVATTASASAGSARCRIVPAQPRERG